ncbi:MAG TPA: hypothetical protein VHJ17_02470, partial [Thermomonospora sp.]|nr:hypothetical protein [Thermomonospora sp.]
SVDRVDQVIVRVRDGVYDGSGVQEGSVEYLKGQPSGAASPLPPSSMALWNVRVPAGATTVDFATAVRAFPYTTGLGGYLPVRNAAERDALPAHDTLTVLRMDTGAIQQRWQGGWREVVVGAADTGWVNLPPVTGWSHPVTPRVRRKGSIVQLRGTARLLASDADTIICTVPTGFRPVDEIGWVAPIGSTVTHLVLYTSGNVRLAPSAPKTLSVDIGIEATWLVGS